MRQLFCINCFEYAFNFFTSFGYFLTQRENRNTIRMVSAALRPKGIFVLDFLNAQYVRAHLVPREQKHIDGVTYTISRWCDGKYFYKKIVITEKKLPRPLEYTERVTVLSPSDFTALFEPNGLHIRRLFGNYELAPFDPEHSPRLILLAEKT
jgi:hypothetical protein